MRDTIQDSAFGHIVHAISRGRFFAWDDKQTLNTTGSEGTSKETLPVASPTHTKEAAEKGQDYELVDWQKDDPANPRNWSTPKKFFVTFEICLLTTSVYIGSAIYTAGIQGVMADFGVSQVVAVLGLTLFVAGYGLGPMVWVCHRNSPDKTIPAYPK
jgi:DHA1 family multidrug resistance protein-like MFS transporter